MGKEIKRSGNRKDNIATIISLIIMFGFGYICPAFEGVTDVGMRCLGVFIGVIFLTIATDRVFFSAAMGMIALIFAGYTTATGAITAWLGNKTNALVIFVSVMCYALREAGVMNILAKKILTMKVLKGRPRLLIYAFFMTTFFICMFMTIAPGMILMYSLFEAIREAAGYDPKSPFSKQMLLGTYLASMGGYALPWMGVQASSVVMLEGVLSGYGMHFSSIVYWLTNVIIFVVFMLIYTLVLPAFKCDLKPLASIDVSTTKSLQEISDRFTKKQKIILAAFAICMIYVILISLLPTTMPGYEWFAKLDTVWIWILAIAVLGLINVDGQPVLKPVEALKNGTMWNLTFLIGCFTMLGGTMTSEELGIRTMIQNLFSPLFSNASLPVMIIMVALIATIGTQFINGMPLTLTLCATVMPFTAELAMAGGFNPSVMGTVMNICNSAAYLTYSGSVFASLILGRDEIDQKFIWTKGVITLCMFIATVIVLGIILSYVLPASM